MSDFHDALETRDPAAREREQFVRLPETIAQAMTALCADERTARRLLNSLIDALLIEDTALMDGPAAGAEDWPWTGRRFRVPTLLRLAWSDARASETEAPRSRRRGLLCRKAARPHQSHTVRLLRCRCMGVLRP